MLRDTLSLHMGGHCHHDEQEETLQPGARHGADVAITRGCDTCYAQKLSFGFGIAESPGGQAAGTPLQGAQATYLSHGFMSGGVLTPSLFACPALRPLECLERTRVGLSLGLAGVPRG